MTCKDCYLYDGCIAGHLHCYDEEGIKKNCKSFKNKNNYVEVVRCMDCEYSKFIKSCSKYMCDKRNEGRGELKYSSDFCSDGRRKTD